MSDDLKLVTVPRELYYHEVAYVRGLEADNERLRDRLNEVDAQLTAEGHIHARECMALRAEKDAEIARLKEVVERLRADNDWLRGVMQNAIAAHDFDIARAALEPKP